MSQRNVKVVVKDFKKWGKKWAQVTIWDKATWIPSFHDIFRIIRAICYCEDQKYPTGEGRGMVRRFLVDCCDPLVEWEDLRDKYEIPNREP